MALGTIVVLALMGIAIEDTDCVMVVEDKGCVGAADMVPEAATVTVDVVHTVVAV